MTALPRSPLIDPGNRARRRVLVAEDNERLDIGGAAVDLVDVLPGPRLRLRA